QPLYHLFLNLGRFNDFRVEVGLWYGESQHIRRLDVRRPFESGHQFRQVKKLGKPGLGTETAALGNEFVKMIFVSFLNSNIYPLKNLLTSRVCIALETPYSKASSHFPIASHLQ
ncbi:MAG: hypothetical protein WAZ24_03160, partial [Blautia wexlerae]